MTDERKQFSKSRADVIPEALERVIKELHLAIRQAALYPPGHPVRTKADSEVYESLQKVLSSQESHSLTAISDRLYIDQQKISVGDPRVRGGLDEMSADFARKFRRRGIRSVIFSRGIELPELEKFLSIMTMEPRDVLTLHGGAGKLLRSAGDVPHIEIVDIEYESVQFLSDDGKEDLMDVEEMLVSFLKGVSGSLSDEAYTHLLSLLERPDLMARLLETCTYQDGTGEPDSSMVEQCMSSLIGIGEQLSDEEKKEFHRKVLEATLQMERPVKDIVFAMSGDKGTVAELMGGLSVDEVVKFAAAESTTGEYSVALWRVFDEFLASDQNAALGSPAERVAEVETAIQGELARMGQEDVFTSTVVPILEEVFVELQVGRLENEQSELERLLDQASPTERRQETGVRTDEMADAFAAEDDVANSAIILMEMLESETVYENYMDIVSQLEETVRTLILGFSKSEDFDPLHLATRDLTMVFRITDALSREADVKSDKPRELRERARLAIFNLGTAENIDRVISSSLRAIGASDAPSVYLDALEKFIRQVGGKTAIRLLVKNLLDVENPPERHELGKILVPMGAAVVSELRKWLPQVQWEVLSKDVMPIMSEIGGAEALDYFSEALNHLNPQVRRSAVSALAKDKSPEAMKLILDKVRDEEEEESIRQLAISVLIEMRDERLVEEMERVIKGKKATLKREAIYALGNIGGEKSILILSDLLRQKRLILGRRQLETMQLNAVEALRRIGTESAIEVLAEMSQKKRGSVKSACDKALASL